MSLSVEKLGKVRIWQIALLSGFVAGFLERMMPDLWENKVGRWYREVAQFRPAASWQRIVA